MDLEKINKEYEKLKVVIDNKKNLLETIKNEVINYEALIKYWEAKKVIAENDHNQADLDIAKDKIKDIKDMCKDKKEELKDVQKEIQEINEKITAKVEQIKSDPELSKHLDLVMAKKYQRKLKANKEKEDKLKDKKEKFTEFKNHVLSSKTLKNHFNAIIDATKQINKLIKELNEINLKTSKTNDDYIRENEITMNEIPNFKDKLNKNKTLLFDNINKNNLKISENEIMEMVNKNLTDKAGVNINAEFIFTKEEGRINRELKGIQKDNRNTEFAFNKLSQESRDYLNSRSIVQGEPEVQGEPVAQGESAVQSEPTAQEEPLKWYQFIKRFKRWNERRNTRTLPEGNRENETEDNSTTITEEPGKEFKDSLKYSIVRNLVEQKEKEDMKSAKEEIKNQDTER